MSEGSNIFQFVDSNYSGEKCGVIEIGTTKCDLINHFLINGYTDLTAINKTEVDMFSSFFCYKIAKKDVKYCDKETLVLHDKGDVKFNTIFRSPEIREMKTNLYYKDEYLKYTESIQCHNNSSGDFFSFPKTKKFNIILSRFVFHLYPPEEDKNIIHKLSELSSREGLIYIKVYNSENENTVGSQFKKKVNTYYYFDSDRLNSYRNMFEVKSEQIIGATTEILLMKK